MRGCLMRKWLDYHGAGHLRGHSCEDTLCESGLTTSPQGVSEPSVARMSQAKVAGQPGGRAPPRSALRGSVKRKLPEHLSSGHFVTQSCENVSGESGRTPMGQGTSRSELRGCLRRKWPNHLSSGHLGAQSCKEVSSESGLNIMGQGISEVSVARMSQAN